MKRKTLKKTIVFVCTGNTCRSPMAEAIFRRIAENLGLVKLKVCSAGVRAKKGDSLNEKSAQVLRENALSLNEFSAKKIDKRTLQKSFAVICMTDKQRDFIMDMRWQALREKEMDVEEIENNVYSFSELVGYEVLDPYGKDIDCYRYVYQLLTGGMQTIMDKLFNESVRKKLRETPVKKSVSTPKKKKAINNSASDNVAETNKIRKK